MKTGKEIVDNWREQPGQALNNIYEVNIDDLEKRIDAALQEARREGNIQGWEEAQRMVNARLGKP